MITRDPVDKCSPDSEFMSEYWELADTLIDGTNAIRLAGEKYLPKFPDEDADSYKYRLKMTKFTNIYRDVVEALAVKPFEESVTLSDGSVPSQISEFIVDVDGGGSDLTTFAASVFFNGVNSAIDWIFVDYPSVEPGTIRTVAEQKAAGVRPFWSHVLARNMLEARSSVVVGNERLDYVRIMEPGSPHRVRIIRRYGDAVVWFLLEKTDFERVPDADWLYVPAGKDDKTLYVEIGRGQLSINVIPLVPFWTGRRNGRTWRFAPAMRDAADLQIELYQEESALKFARTMTAFPILTGNGVRPSMLEDGKTPKKLRIGPNLVLYAPPDAAGNVGSWAFVEPSSTSLKFLADHIKDTISQLRELGRQPLTAQSGNLTVITTAVAAGKAKSAVGSWAKGLEVALNAALAITGLFYGLPDYKPTTNVYDDFDEFDASGKDLEELSKARANKDLSQKTYWQELKRRRVLCDEFNAETEIEELLNETPSGEGA